MSTLNRYEGIFIFAPELDETAVREQIEKIETLAKAHGGTIEQQDIWGRRELGYKMKKKSYGVYVCLVFSGDGSLVASLDRQMRIAECVLRHMVVAKDKDAPDLSAERREDIQGFNFATAPQAADDDLAAADPTLAQ